MGRASETRRARVSSLLISTLSEFIREELNDPRIGIFTLTEVKLAADLTSATINVAVAEGREATEKCVAVLNNAAPLLRNRVRDATDLRIVPQLRFMADHRGEYLDEIEELLKTVPPPVSSADEDSTDVPETADGQIEDEDQ